MRTTADFSSEDTLLADFGSDLVGLDEPIRCNHIVLLLCRCGSATLEINYTLYSMSQDAFLAISPLDIVTSRQVTPDFRCTALVLPPSILGSVFTSLDIKQYEYIKSYRTMVLKDGYLAFVQQTLTLLETAKGLVPQEKFNKIAEKQVSSLLHVKNHYYQNMTDVKSTGKEYLSRKKELFRKFIQELVSLHAVSREVLFYANELGVSCGYLNELCNEVSGRSAKEIIDSAVAAKLKYELTYTSKSIQELADEYNFPSQSYFSRYYKRLTGVSPREYRKKCGG